MARSIDNSQDVIDSRDIIERIDELQDIETRDDDENEELTALKALADDAEGYSDDWKYGATLIRDSYFKDYAQELADDIGAISREAKWPNNHIDWDADAEELKQDYTSVTFDGVDYWVR